MTSSPTRSSDLHIDVRLMVLAMVTELTIYTYIYMSVKVTVESGDYKSRTEVIFQLCVAQEYKGNGCKRDKMTPKRLCGMYDKH